MAQGRFSYSTPVRPSDAPILDQNASASNQMSMLQFAAFDRVMQRMLGFGVDMYDRNQAKERYQTEQDRLNRAEQRGIEATAEEQRRYGQAQQIASGVRGAGAVRDVRSGKAAASDYAGLPGFELVSRQPVVDQRFPAAPAGPDLYGLPAPAQAVEGPPEPVYGQSPLDTAQQAAYQSQRQGAFTDASKLGMQIQTATDLESQVTFVRSRVGTPGGFTQAEADDFEKRMRDAFATQEAARKKLEEARLAIQRTQANSSSGIAPQRFTSRDLDEAAYAGDIDAYNRYRKAQGIRPLVLSNAEDKQQWEQVQSRSRDMRQQRVSSGDITANKVLASELWTLKDDPAAALEYGAARGLSEDQVRRMITSHDQTIKRPASQATAADKATAGIIQEKIRTIGKLETRYADATKLADKTAIREQINKIRQEIGGAMGDLAASDVRVVLEDPNIPSQLKRFVRESSDKADAQLIASMGSANDEELVMIRDGGDAYSPATKKAARKELGRRAPLTSPDATPQQKFEALNPIQVVPPTKGARRSLPANIIDASSVEQLQRILQNPEYDQKTKDRAAAAYRARRSTTTIPGGVD
jgi:hypothetical protein